MSRTEERIRNAERLGDRVTLLRERLRAGDLQRDRLRIAAHLGDADAAKALEWDDYYVMVSKAAGVPFVKDGEYFRSQGGLTDDWGRHWRQVFAEDMASAREQAKLGRWSTALAALLAPLGTRESMADCPQCDGKGYHEGWNNDPLECASERCVEGKRTITVPWSRWLFVAGSLAACQVMLPSWEARRGWLAKTFKRKKKGRLVRLVPHKGGLINRIAGDALRDDYVPRDALAAAQVWLDEPSRANQVDLQMASSRLGAIRRWWDAPYLHSTGDHEQASLCFVGDAESMFREVFRNTVVPLILK